MQFYSYILHKRMHAAAIFPPSGCVHSSGYAEMQIHKETKLRNCWDHPVVIKHNSSGFS
jgi:hypothetical protein